MLGWFWLPSALATGWSRASLWLPEAREGASRRFPPHWVTPSSLAILRKTASSATTGRTRDMYALRSGEKVLPPVGAVLTLAVASLEEMAADVARAAGVRPQSRWAANDAPITRVNAEYDRRRGIGIGKPPPLWPTDGQRDMEQTSYLSGVS
jgi:hypothetical protein